jgi:hypothetical protein
MECPPWRSFISSRSVNKHGLHRQFLSTCYTISALVNF